MGLKFYTINEDYGKYLNRFDKLVQDVSRINNKEHRPFIGILFEINNIKYIAPLASPKPKHQTMKNQTDFLKINNGVWGAINFNNMIPVSDLVINIIDLKIYKTDTKDDIAYKELLNNQRRWCNSHETDIRNKAEYLYKGVVDKKLNKNLINRCCDFKLLETKLQEYLYDLSQQTTCQVNKFLNTPNQQKLLGLDRGKLLKTSYNKARQSQNQMNNKPAKKKKSHDRGTI